MPRRGARPSGAGGRLAGGGTEWVWTGEPVKERFMAAIAGGMVRLKRRAEQYWQTEEWTKARHPYMTGDENSIRENGYFRLEQTKQGSILFTFGSTSAHAGFEEFGHGSFPGHHPVRNVLDRYGYRMTDVIREEARAQGLV